MKVLDKKTAGDLTRLLVFIVVTTMATAVLVVTIGNISFGGTRPFKAEFVDATGVVKGDDVRIAGVKVGSVTDVEIVERTRALVSFDLDESAQVTGSTTATIRYRNLVGQRYISLTDKVGDTQPLEPGSTIPVTRTQPALDLTVLFNGFKPLFQALSPADVNKLSFEIVQVLQGEGGTLESLLGRTASLTTTLAERDEVISSLIVNLNQVLDHLADRDDQLSDLIVSYKNFVAGLKTDRNAILGSLEQISLLSEETAGLVTGLEEPLVQDIKHLRQFATNLNRNKGEIDRALQVLPIKLTKVGRTAIYGAWFNFYLCHFTGSVKLPVVGEQQINYKTGTPRCDLG